MEAQEVINQPTQFPTQHSPVVINRLELIWLRIRVFLQLYRIVNRKSRNTFAAIRSIIRVKKKYESIFGEVFLGKVTKVGGRYFWRLAAPGFPSTASFEMQRHEVNRFFPNEPREGLRSLIFSLTNKCPLNCQHCFEWHNLNREEQLQTNDIIDIVHKYQDFGTTQIMLSGGEPMLRINSIYELLKAAREGTDFWIITSGIGFSEKTAVKLKKLGLTGVMVSLDHYKEDKHNSFRGYKNSYKSAIETVIQANKVGLVTALSLCATKAFVSHENLFSYMELAKNLGVSFVQVLEPRSAGRYKGIDVSLSNEQQDLIEKMYLEYNSSPMFADYPLIHYLGYHQRKVGCFGAGNRFFYIDADGDAHICPYCTNKIGNVRDISVSNMIETLGQRKCHTFKKNLTI